MDKLFSVLWRIVGVLSVLVITAFIWLYFFVPRPQTISTNYISALTLYDDEDTPLEDATIVSNINVYRNKDKTNNSQQLFEWSMTTYQGTNYTEKATKGIQIVGDYKATPYRSYRTVKDTRLWGQWKNFYLWYDIGIDNLYSYDISYDKDSNTGTAYASPTALNNNSVFVVSVGNGEEAKLAQLRFRKQVLNSKYYRQEWFGFYDNYLSNWSEYNLVSLNYTIGSIYKTISSLNEGTYYLTLDLAEFFDVYIADDDGQFNIQTTDTQFTYVTCKVSVNDEGMTTRNQSMYGMVAQNDGSISFEYDEEQKLYWQAHENITLGSNVLESRYSDYYNGNLLYITNETISKYKDYKNLRIHLIIDLSQFENVIGIDSFGLDGLNYHDITILGNKQDFYFMSNSLTNIKVGKIYHSQEVKPIVYDNANMNIELVA